MSTPAPEDFTPTPGRRNLVFLRAGRVSTHGPLAVTDRSYDLLVDSWAGNAHEYVGTCDHVYSSGARNLANAVHDLFTERPDLLDHYDAVWLTCDDIETQAEVVEALFALHAARGDALAQPALSLDSYFAHALTVQHPGLSVREVTFVEFMVPLFTTAALAECLEVTGQTVYTWGVDSVWAAQLRNRGERCAVYDCLPVRHTRPLSSEGVQGGTVEQAMREAINLEARHGMAPGVLPKGVVRAWDDAFVELPTDKLYCRLEAAFPPPETLMNLVDEHDVYARALRETRRLIDEGVLDDVEEWKTPGRPVSMTFLLHCQEGSGGLSVTLDSIRSACGEEHLLSYAVVLLTPEASLGPAVVEELSDVSWRALTSASPEPWRAFTQVRGIPEDDVVVSLRAGEVFDHRMLSLLTA